MDSKKTIDSYKRKKCYVTTYIRNISIFHHFLTSQVIQVENYVPTVAFVFVWYLQAVDDFPGLFLVALCNKVIVCCLSCERHATGSSWTAKLPRWLFWLIVMVVTPVICGLWPILTNWDSPQSGIWGWKRTKKTHQKVSIDLGGWISSGLWTQICRWLVWTRYGDLMIETGNETTMNKPWDWYQISLQDMLRLAIWDMLRLAIWDVVVETQYWFVLGCNLLCILLPAFLPVIRFAFGSMSQGITSLGKARDKP